MSSDTDQDESVLSITSVISKAIPPARSFILPTPSHLNSKSTLHPTADSPSTHTDHTLSFVGRVVCIDSAHTQPFTDKEEEEEDEVVIVEESKAIWTRDHATDSRLGSLATETNHNLVKEQSQRKDLCQVQEKISQCFILWLSDAVVTVLPPQTVIVLDSDDEGQDSGNSAQQAKANPPPDPNTPEQSCHRFVAILVDETMIRPAIISTASSSNAQPTPYSLLNDWIQITDALVLGGRDYGARTQRNGSNRHLKKPCVIVPAIGISGQTRAQVSKAPSPVSRKRRHTSVSSSKKRRRTSIDSETEESTSRPWTPSLASTTKPSLKRCRSFSVKIVESIGQERTEESQVTQRPRLDKEPSMTLPSSSSSSSSSMRHPFSFQMPSFFQHRSSKEIDPLELLIRDKDQEGSFPEFTEGSMPSMNSQLTLVTEAPRLYFSELWNAYDQRSNEVLSLNDDRILTRHICWLARIEIAQIRAVCGECANDYKGMYCTFGCGSRRWRLEILVDFVASDGSAEMQCRIEGEQAQESMWALLGLGKKRQPKVFSDKGKDKDEQQRPPNIVQPNVREETGARLDPIEEQKKKILCILARRGELSYRRTETSVGVGHSSLSAQPAAANTTTKSSHAASTETSDSSERAQAEQRLWSNLCIAAAPCQAPLSKTSKIPMMAGAGQRRSMMLTVYGPTTTSPGSFSSGTTGARSGATVDRSMQLQRTNFRIGRMSGRTVTRPPMILQVVHVEPITPLQEARLLLKNLGRRPQ